MSGALVKIHDYCLAASTRRFFRQRLAGFRPRPIVVSAELQEGWHRRDVVGRFFSQCYASRIKSECNAKIALQIFGPLGSVGEDGPEHGHRAVRPPAKRNSLGIDEGLGLQPAQGAVGIV